jgi:hypothetical protein
MKYERKRWNLVKLICEKFFSKCSLQNSTLSRFSMRLTAKKLILLGLLIIGLGTYFDFDANEAEKLLDDG